MIAKVNLEELREVYKKEIELEKLGLELLMLVKEVVYNFNEERLNSKALVRSIMDALDKNDKWKASTDKVVKLGKKTTIGLDPDNIYLEISNKDLGFLIPTGGLVFCVFKTKEELLKELDRLDLSDYIRKYEAELKDLEYIVKAYNTAAAILNNIPFAEIRLGLHVYRNEDEYMNNQHSHVLKTHLPLLWDRN